MSKETLLKEVLSLRSDFPNLQSLTDESLFSLVCLKYFYVPDNFTYEHYNKCFTDGTNDGGIDLVVVSEVDGYTSTLSLIQSKFVSDLSNKQDIVDIFTKIQQTYDDFQNEKTANYNANLKRILREQLDYVSDLNNTVEFVLFISIACEQQRKDEIAQAVARVEALKDFQITIHYLDDIDEQVRNIKEPKRFVDEGKIRISQNDGVLSYGKEGILVNISANSLRDVYDRYKDKGLFEQNFRYFIRNKKIDENIRESLGKKREDFWFLNNGIIICCKEFQRDGDNVKLFDFSIVNGCQTTTLIGEYKGQNEHEDFFLPCKIIKSKYESEEAFSRFMSDVAEASNSQKPISDRDLKANRPEQRRLQRFLKDEDPKIYLEIKRGEKMPRGLQPWQKVKNDVLGQIILSFYLQQPGTARNAKGLIFSNDKTYKSIFLREPSKSNIVDLLKLASYYDSFLNAQIKEGKFVEVEQNTVGSNGKFVIIALMGLLLKNKRGLLQLSQRQKGDEASLTETEDLHGEIFDSSYRGDDFEKRLFGLYRILVVELAGLFKTREKEEKTVSNFFKSDSKYQQIIVKHVISNLLQDDYKMDGVNNRLEIFA